MRLASIVLGAFLAADPAAAQFIDRDAVFARAREVAAVTLPGIKSADLAPFRISYDLTLLETGDPAGGFEVDLLLRSSREVVPALEIISAAPDTEAASRLENLLAGVEFAYHYRTVRVRFTEQGEAAPSAEFSTLLLNRDPEPPAEALSSDNATDLLPLDRRNP
jgi:hypothetical protein